MAQHLSIDLFGVVHGAADGTGAIIVLAAIAIAAILAWSRAIRTRG